MIHGYSWKEKREEFIRESNVATTHFDRLEDQLIKHIEGTILVAKEDLLKNQTYEWLYKQFHQMFFTAKYAFQDETTTVKDNAIMFYTERKGAFR